MSQLLTDLENYKKQFIRQKNNSNFSLHTIRHYETGLKFFLEYIAIRSKSKNELLATNIDEEFMYDFIDWISNKHGVIKASTKKQYVIRIGAFLRYVTKKSHKRMDFISMLSDVKVKVERSERKHLSDRERKNLADYLDMLEGANDKRDIQNTLIAKLLLFTGLRAFELRALKVSDFELDGEGVYNFKVIGKGNKEDWLYIRESLIKDELERLPFKYICETRLGKPMSHVWLWKMTARIFVEAGIDETGVHIFRHTFAKILVDNNVTLTTIKELLRHADIKTTQIYAKSDEAAKKKAVLGVFKF